MIEKKPSIQLLRSLQTNVTISSDDSQLCKKRFLSYTSHLLPGARSVSGLC